MPVLHTAALIGGLVSALIISSVVAAIETIGEQLKRIADALEKERK